MQDVILAAAGAAADGTAGLEAAPPAEDRAAPANAPASS